MQPLDRLERLRAKPRRLALGLMSGMSVDGLDLALVRVGDEGERCRVELVASRTAPYEEGWRQRIRVAVGGTTREVATLHFDLADHWAGLVLAFLDGEGVAPADVDVLGSHGQTLAHVSPGTGRAGATLQVGDGDVLAERTGILTVTDFRARDVAAGGEGAPLVPLADWLLFARPGQVEACHNLGSIANVTVVTERPEDVLAFDTGPANALVDRLASRCEEAPGGIDRDGEVSARGSVRPEALAFLFERRRAFLERPPPRSAGYEDFGPALAEETAAAHPRLRPVDLLRTVVEFTALTLAQAYERHVLPRHPALRHVRLSGGGVHNRTLVGRIREHLRALGLEVRLPPGRWADAKEAVAFALLADRTVRGRPGNLPSATGARRPVVLGKISL